MASPPLVSHPSPSSSSDVEEEEVEPEAKVARLCSGEQLVPIPGILASKYLSE